jgi:hypothetical protein
MKSATITYTDDRTLPPNRQIVQNAMRVGGGVKRLL